MNVEQSMCAASGPEAQWEWIDWPQCELKVRRLQERIVNPIIRGWAYYHRHIVADSAYRKVRMALWYSLWRWAKRRHPNKSSSWILHRYWDCFGQSKWYFTALAGSHAQRSRPYVVRLVDPTDITIQRYLKVKSDATRSAHCGVATSSLEREI
jgi:hypothetical protein